MILLCLGNKSKAKADNLKNIIFCYEGVIVNCNKCGAAIPNDAKFCCYCGAEIVEYDQNDVAGKLDQILKFLKGKQPEPAENKTEIVKSNSIFEQVSNEISQVVIHTAESLK